MVTLYSRNVRMVYSVLGNGYLEIGGVDVCLCSWVCKGHECRAQGLLVF